MYITLEQAILILNYIINHNTNFSTALVIALVENVAFDHKAKISDLMESEIIKDYTMRKLKAIGKSNRIFLNTNKDLDDNKWICFLQCK